MIKNSVKWLAMVAVLGSFVALVPGQGRAGMQLYLEKAEAPETMARQDKRTLNSLTSIRYSLMAGYRDKALLDMKALSDKLGEEAARRKYESTRLVLLRIKEGRHPTYLYFPASYEAPDAQLKPEEEIEEGELEREREGYQPLTLFDGKRRDAIRASLDMDYTLIRGVLAKAYALCTKKDLEKADEALQDLYTIMIDNPELENDPIEIAKEQYKEAIALLKQGKVAEAIQFINDSEKLLSAYIQENPDTPHMSRLEKIMLGYDKIRGYHFGQAGEVSSVRDRIFMTLSDMKSKLKYIKNDLEL